MTSIYGEFKPDPFRRYYCIPILSKSDTRVRYQPYRWRFVYAPTPKAAVAQFRKENPEFENHAILTMRHKPIQTWPRPILPPDPRFPGKQMEFNA